MRKTWLAAVLIALAVALTAYLTTDNLFVALGVLAVLLIYYFIFLDKPLKRYVERTLQVHECYNFVNTFFITMSVKNSLIDAYESGLVDPSKTFRKELEQLEDMDVLDRLVYLRKYFNLSIYRLFINIVNLYQEQGGDILALGEPVVNETVRMESYVRRVDLIGKRKAIEFAILWLMTFGVLLIMRFGIKEFYDMMLASPMFVAMICLFYLVFLLSLHVFVKRFVFLSLKEDQLDE